MGKLDHKIAISTAAGWIINGYLDEAAAATPDKLPGGIS